jgi:uncharacterized protein (TIGR00730 family)
VITVDKKDNKPKLPPEHLATAPVAYENEDFLNSSDGRPFRILSEYAEPLARFRRERIQDTVVFFGSARIRSMEVATAALQKARAGADQEQLRRAETAVEMSHYYEDARKLARMMAGWACSLGGPRHRFVVTSGGGPGIMEAANRGAFEAGCRTIGLNIALPFEQEPNHWITPELNFQFHYFFMRKLWFAYLAKALVVFPGGFGTFDEMFEMLTLAQTQKMAKKITVVIYGSSYWNSIINMQTLVDKGVIAPEDVNLFQFADTPEQAFSILQAGLIANHLQPHAQETSVPPPPKEPAPSAQELLGPDISKTRA